MIHLTEADYTSQPWKNGRGTTTELFRIARDRQVLVRISRAAVAEDGPFSTFPGLDRSLTVLSGPGFRLTGEGLDLRCDALVPVAFAGDLPVTAVETGGAQSEDLNVMTARFLARPQVTVERAGSRLEKGGLIALYALGPVQAGDRAMAPGDLVLTRDPVGIAGDWPVIAVRLAI